MKKGFVIVLLMVFASTFVSAQVKWYSWNEGYAKAKKENKIVVMDVYTEWCGWCKVMDKKTYTHATVISKMASAFIAIKINPETDKNLTYDGKVYTGKELVDLLSKNMVEGYPTTIFFYLKSKKVYLEVGYLATEKFIPLLDKYSKMK